MRNPNRNPSTEQSSSSSSSLTNISTTPSNPTERIDDKRIFLSPGFKSVAAMAGWDEEAILLATLVVEDTPERRGGKLEKKKRTEFQFKTPPTNSRRKPKTQKRGSASIPAVVLNLDDEEDTSNSGRVFEKDKKETDANKINSEQQERELDLRARRSSASASSSSTTNNTSVIRPDTDKKELETNEKITKKKQEKDDVQRSSVPSSASSLASTSQSLPEADQKEPKTDKINSKKEDRKEIDDQLDGQRSSAPNPCTSNLPDMDKLREELSCAICLEICFEPSTTTCGHSFCKKCLRSAADKCGKRCPKCRQLIGNGRSCTVNTVLWNTIQLLFPSEIEVRRIASAAAADNNKRGTEQQQKHERAERGTERRLSLQHRRRHHSSHLPQRAPSNSNNQVVVIPSQNEDAALALRLQREEFMSAYGSSSTRMRTRTTRDGGREHGTSNNALAARANLRAMAIRAISLRTRNPPV